MIRGIIKISYRHIIDASATTVFERNVFNATYNEFLLKSQAYNMEKLFSTFTEMKINNGKANSLHYKISFAIGPFINELKNKMPDLQDNAGNEILFENCSTTLIESHVNNAALHKLSITFTTGIVTLIDSFGDNLLLAYGDKRNETTLETFLLKLVYGVSITNYIL